MEDLIKFVADEALVLIPVLWIIGKIVKASPVANWVIPWVLLILGVVFTNGYLGVSWESVFQGVIVSGLAVFTHQLVGQLGSDRK